MPLKPSSTAFTVLLAALAALPPLSIDMNLPAVPPIEASFGEPAGRGALTLSLFVAGFLVSPLVGGPLADRFGRRPTLLGALIAYGLAAMACALAPSFMTLLLARFLQGTAAGLGAVLPLAIIRDVFEGSAARHRLSQVTAMIGVAPLAAPALGSLVLAFGGWPTIYVVQAVAAAGLALSFLLLFRETLPPERRQSIAAGALLRNIAFALRQREFTGYTLVFGFGFGALFAYVSGSATLLIDELGLSNLWFSLLFAAVSAGLILGSLLSGRLNKRDVAVRGIMTGCLMASGLCATGALLVVVLGWIEVWTIMPWIFGLVFCFGLSAPNITHAAIHPLPQMAGSASGIMRSLQMLIGAGTSALVTLLIEPLDPALAMTLTIFASTACSILVYLLLLHGRSVPRPGA